MLAAACYADGAAPVVFAWNETVFGSSCAVIIPALDVPTLDVLALDILPVFDIPAFEISDKHPTPRCCRLGFPSATHLPDSKSPDSERLSPHAAETHQAPLDVASLLVRFESPETEEDMGKEETSEEQGRSAEEVQSTVDMRRVPRQMVEGGAPRVGGKNETAGSVEGDEREEGRNASIGPATPLPLDTVSRPRSTRTTPGRNTSSEHNGPALTPQAAVPTPRQIPPNPAKSRPARSGISSSAPTHSPLNIHHSPLRVMDSSRQYLAQPPNATCPGFDPDACTSGSPVCCLLEPRVRDADHWVMHVDTPFGTYSWVPERIFGSSARLFYRIFRVF
ncbi:hypothetical protein FB45DRAFT_1012040 [Roridomyces roridus]|uniref:Uncharacterized protein n=1 Tax=Roridomyces roridus TaxID=1738132 RepID=A0AAD7F715_9AGAR|nr:hypothetical protein FB45DRAFT_1012040 [Roridomyces roridus]